MTSPPRRVALVTGASRGIGKATAIALAQAGFDVAITARTMQRGQGRDDSDVGHGVPVEGSLEETAEAIEAYGGEALAVFADLTDLSSLPGAVDVVLSAFGRIDVLVNNAIFTGPGGMVPFMSITAEQFETRLRANVVAQVVLTQAVLPTMVDAGGGLVVDVTSHVATADPPAPVGEGGWGLGYAASKAAFHRMAGILAVELGPRGICAVNIDPGYVDTERQLANADANGLSGHYRGAPPSVPAAVIAWLAASEDVATFNGQTLVAQRVALEHQLHEDWRAPRSAETTKGPRR